MDATTSAIATVSGLAGLVVFIAGTVGLAWWMLEPINRAAGSLRAPTRFMLADFLALMILLQVGLAIVGQALDESGSSRSAITMYWLMLSTIAVLTLVLWAASVSVVSRAGILRPVRRLAVIVLLVPGTLAVIMGAPVLLAMLLAAIFAAFRQSIVNEATPRQIPWLVLALAGTGLTVLAMRWLSFWALVGSSYSAALPQGFVEQHGSSD
jgi:hypothetical protein